jgi:uncharacterized repeat protein (TIGR03843 family)
MPRLETSIILNVLQNGEIQIKGEFAWGSNYTFLTEVCQYGHVLQSVYKPSRGERPLWDFPAASLARRETAAYLVSEALGWELVPPTVYRKKAPIGPGSLQLYVVHDPKLNYFSLNETERQRLRPVALFDLLVNNADRKGSHLLYDNNHHLWLIDHGICFHPEDKLRTVIWDFIGEPIPQKLHDDIRCFHQLLAPEQALYKKLLALLNQKEICALARRAERLISMDQFPAPNPEERSIPWPPL